MGQLSLPGVDPPDNKDSPFGFTLALVYLKQGMRVSRKGWNGKGMWIALWPEGSENPMSKPFLYIATFEGVFVPWTASQTDLLSEDWVLLPAD